MRVLELLTAYYIEGFLIVGGGLSILNIRPKLSKIACLAIMYSLVIFGVREIYQIYNIPFGTHSFIIIMLQIIILKYIGKQNWVVSVITPLISFLLISWGEGILMFNIINLIDITLQDIMHTPGFRLVGILLSNIPLIVIFILGYIFKISVIDINRFIEKEEI